MDPQRVTKTVVAVKVGIFLIVEQLLKPGFCIVIMIAEQVSDHVPKRISQLTCRLQVFFCEGLIFSMIITTWRPSKFKYSKIKSKFISFFFSLVHRPEFKLSHVQKV